MPTAENQIIMKRGRHILFYFHLYVYPHTCCNDGKRQQQQKKLLAFRKGTTTSKPFPKKQKTASSISHRHFVCTFGTFTTHLQAPFVYCRYVCCTSQQLALFQSWHGRTDGGRVAALKIHFSSYLSYQAVANCFILAASQLPVRSTSSPPSLSCAPLISSK